MPTGRTDPGRTLTVFLLVLGLTYGLVALAGVWKPRLGLDLEGGTRITLLAEDGVRPAQLEQARRIVEARVGSAGVADAEVTTQGEARVVVEVAGESRRDLVETVTRRAELGFRGVAAVAAGVPGATATPDVAETVSPAPSVTPAPTESQAPHANRPPYAWGMRSADDPLTWLDDPGQRWLEEFEAFGCPVDGNPVPVDDDPARPLIACDDEGRKLLLSGVVLDGSDVGSATATPPTPSALGWGIGLEFTDAGAETFARLSERLTGSGAGFAAVLDGRVVAAPQIEATVTDGRVQLSGTRTQSEAQALAASLEHGALPIRFADKPSIELVGPTLAGTQLDAAVAAALVGLLLAGLVVLVLLRTVGVVLIASVVVAAALVHGLVLLLGEGAGLTLSLPALAGLVVGLAVVADSCFVILAATRAGLRAGLAPRPALDAGWQRVRGTLLAADSVLLLAALTLHLSTSGAVRGLALTLGLVALVDGATAFWFTRPLLDRLASRWAARQGSTPSAVDGRRTRTWWVISVLGLACATAVLGVRGLDQGIEFTGGAEYHVTLPAGAEDVDQVADRVRAALVDSGVVSDHPSVVTTSGTEGLLVQTGSVTDAQGIDLVDTLLEVTGASAADISQTEIGPSWGEETGRQILVGLVAFLALVSVLLRRRLRSWRSTAAALLALAHDLVLTLGVCAAAGLDLSAATVAGLLAVVAFSLHDKVVVLDWVATGPVAELRSRSFGTALVVLAPVAAVPVASLATFGAGSLRDLAVVLLAGVAIGLYSSVCIAAPLARRGAPTRTLDA